MKNKRLITTAPAIALFVAFTHTAHAQITVGGNGSNTTDSTSYSGSQSLTKVGSNTVTLTAVSSYTGGTIVNTGTLSLASSNLLADSGTVTINSGGTLNLGTNGDYIGTLVMNGNATVAGTSGAGGGQFILTQGLSGSPSLKTLTATGANNTIQTNIGISSQWGGVGGNANLRFDVVGASDSLTVDGVIADKSFDGGGSATSGAISKLGAGTLILAGDNTYMGGVTLTSGTIQVGIGGTKGNITGNDAAISNSGTLVINRSDSYGLGNAISGTGSLVHAGAGTTTVSGANSFTGGTTINAGSLLLGAANRLADSGAVVVNGGSLDLGGFSDTVGAVTLSSGSIANGTLTASAYDLQSGTASAVLAGTAALTKSGVGTVTLSANNTYTGATTIAGGTLQVGTGGTSGTLGSGAVTNNGTLAINRSNAVTLGDKISGTGSLVQAGSGTTTIGAANTFTGAVIIQGGTLQLSSNGSFAAGSSLVMSAGATMDLNNKSQTFAAVSGQGGTVAMGSGTLTVNNSGADEYNGVITGSGALTKQGVGTLTLGGNNTYSGGATVSGGKLAGTTTSLKGAITNNAQVEFAQNGDGTYSGSMSGNGSLTKSGAGGLVMSGTSTYTGVTTVEAGQLKVNGSIASSDVTVNSGAVLSGSGTVGGIGGAGSINPGNSPGILTAAWIDPSDGMFFNFEITDIKPEYSQATNSANDVLRLSSATPFTSAMDAGNMINVYFNVADFDLNQAFLGGIFTDESGDFTAMISGANFTYYVQDNAGSVTYNGVSYSELGAGFGIEVTTELETADFGSGAVNGRIMQFGVVPEPSSALLAAIGSLFLLRRSRKA
jgi:autotransporter-associated beta strand protein